VECTRVDVSEDARVGRQAGEAGEDTWTRARVHKEEVGRSGRGPGREKANAGAPVGAGDSPDKALDGQTPVDCGVADALADGGRAVEAGNGVLNSYRGVKVGGVAAVVGVEVEVEVDGGDNDATAVVVEHSVTRQTERKKKGRKTPPLYPYLH
jgi:hypothetical protein